MHALTKNYEKKALMKKDLLDAGVGTAQIHVIEKACIERFPTDTCIA